MPLIKFKEYYLAQTFTDYMKSKGVILRLQRDNEGYTLLFLDNEQHRSVTEAELLAFVKSPYDKRYSHASWQLAAISAPTHQKPPLNSDLSNDPSVISTTKLMPVLTKVGPVTIIVTVTAITLYILLFFIGSMTILDWLGYPISSEYYSQVWLFITPIFIHFSLLHILFNLTWWWYLGGMIEKRIGSLKLIEITLLTGLLSNYCQAQISGPYFGGLSGVVYGLMGYVWLYGELVKNSGLKLERTMIIFAIIWLIAGYIDLLGSIANTAHLVGLIVGLLLAVKDRILIRKNSLQ